MSSSIMKITFALTVTLCTTLLHFGKPVNCVPIEVADELSHGADNEGALYASDMENVNSLNPEARNKRYYVNPYPALAQAKRQGSGEFDMLRNLAISRLVKRAGKRAPSHGRRLAISRLIKRNPYDLDRLPFNDYDIDGLSDLYPDTFLPTRAVKDAESSKFSALWKTRVG